VTPPDGVIVYAVFIGEGIKPALKWDKTEAADYAARYHGEYYPLVVGRRKEELKQTPDLD
jgi:hypothetical protein